MPEERDINRCAVKGCPVIGHWPQGGTCPMHRDEEPARMPTLAELWEVDR